MSGASPAPEIALQPVPPRLQVEIEQGFEGELRIKVIQARNLKDLDAIGEQDPFVQFSYKGQTFKTKVQPSAGSSCGCVCVLWRGQPRSFILDSHA